MSVDATIALCTLDELKEAVRATGTSTDDTALEHLVDRASMFANTYCGRQLLQKSYVEFYDGDGTKELMLNNYPIVSVTHLYDDPNRDYDASTELVADDDYLLESKAGIIRLPLTIFNKGIHNVKV